ncbi:hypothetical protein ABIA33_006150 [Streptacidiphilus sp. MAP12-16]|uniref:transglycosylase SLT domain-containing protein n=1 Tax=Streptacidiphilus sp. MAP12-16 TaxID=3156300 RepID=UPI003514B281
MAERSRRWSWVVLAAVVVAIGWAAQHGGRGAGTAGSPTAASSGTATGSASGSATARPSAGAAGDPAPTVSADPYDPARFAAQVVSSARRAGVGPQMLMAILYNESYKPHDPALERAWQRLKPDAAFGIANMHKATFDDTKKGRDFAGRDWQQLPDDPALAIEAAAWYLHDLAAQLPAHRSNGYTEDELLALGYNTGASNMRAFARGVKLGSMAQTYLDHLHQNWATAAVAVKGH